MVTVTVNSYDRIRIDRGPRMIDVYIRESGGPPRAPAPTNALYSATGRRIPTLPIADRPRTT